ncbi:MAG: aldo/keto reductase [Gulosibacter sp.]|uniref:aldo/keto reductase n=1 Tax=Gulosibacter sp. TaxID=2817531 RepID=UPI003F918A8E
MRRNQLGETGLDVSILGFGTAPFGQLFGPVSFEQARKALLRALELGVNFIDTSPYYGDAEERLGRMAGEIPDEVLIGTKAGRYGIDDFDFSPERIRSSVENSLRVLKRDRIDVFQLHDIDFGDLDRILSESYDELVRLRDEGKVRAIGMTCYSIATSRRVLLETDVDVILNFAHGTLLDDSLSTELSPIARENGTGIINAAAVALGLLTPKVLESSDQVPDSVDLQPVATRDAARNMAVRAKKSNVDIAFLANQYSTQQVDCDTTIIGTTNIRHLEDAVRATESELDRTLIEEVLSYRLPSRSHQWQVGIQANDVWNW